MRILIIEDDGQISANLYDYLEGRGHSMDAAADGVTGLHLAVTGEFDAIVLDVRLPGIDGMLLCRKLREEARRDTPVLMLTARDALDDKLQGFSAGADDYLVKPYSLQEVEARLLAIAKRQRGGTGARVLRAGGLTFDAQTMTIDRGGEVIKLPPKCIRILERLMQSPQRVFTRAELETFAWGNTLPNSDTLRSHMHLLRRALAKGGHADPIETVHGIGYRLAAANAA